LAVAVAVARAAWQ
jgi:hypothetical protein